MTVGDLNTSLSLTGMTTSGCFYCAKIKGGTPVKLVQTIGFAFSDVKLSSNVE